jgi:hypothetical protein
MVVRPSPCSTRRCEVATPAVCAVALLYPSRALVEAARVRADCCLALLMTCFRVRARAFYVACVVRPPLSNDSRLCGRRCVVATLALLRGC